MYSPVLGSVFYYSASTAVIEMLTTCSLLSINILADSLSTVVTTATTAPCWKQPLPVTVGQF